MSIVSYEEAHKGPAQPIRRTEEEVESMYEEWVAHHGKAYNALGEKERRFQVFKNNLRLIDEHNSDKNRTFRLALNHFADLTDEEFRAMYLGARVGGRNRESDRYAPRVGESLPDSVDSREDGAVVEVKDQGSCDNTNGPKIAKCYARVYKSRHINNI